MRIIFLNCFTGKYKIPLFEFIDKHSKDTDMFCFQEVSVSLQAEFERLLSNFNSVYKEGFLLSFINEIAGQSIFFNQEIKLISSEKIILHELISKDIGFLLKSKFETDNNQFLIGNIHGKAHPSNKFDSIERLEQSKIILKAFNGEKLPKIIGGDFNLLRNTKSIEMFDIAGYKNLIKDFGIVSTRNKLTWELYKNDIGFVKQYDSDYCFVSPDVKVKNFSVPNVEVSDHEPLILDFEI